MDRKIQKGIGVRLGMLRTKKNETQKIIADYLGMTQAAYGKIESGDRGLNSENCIALADYFNVSCDYILRGIESENIDICTGTCLEHETVKILRDRRKKQIDAFRVYEAKKKIREEIYDTLSNADCSGQGEIYKQVRKVEKEEDQAYCIYSEEEMLGALLNELIKNEPLANELKKACAGVCRSMIDSMHKINLPLDETYYSNINLMEINASRYIAGQAFGEFFKSLCCDADFIRKITEQPEDIINAAIEDGLLKIKDKEG